MYNIDVSVFSQHKVLHKTQNMQNSHVNIANNFNNA